MANQKKIVYLLGSGATNAELVRIGSDIDLTMKSINERIFDNRNIDRSLKKFLQGDSRNLNIEHIISLLESYELREYTEKAQKFRVYFQKEILNAVRIRQRNVKPILHKVLLDYHEKDSTGESLTGFITLNYDSLGDEAFMMTHKKINYGFHCDSDDYTTEESVSTPLLLKIHGSFNWKPGIPITVSEDSKFLNEYNSLWIPPSTFKKFDNYPFNLIWGKAFKLLLECDTLRIIGCSLSQNDWALLSLLFKTRYGRKSPYRIEIIDKPKRGEEIRNRCAFLGTLVSIEELEPEVFDMKADFLKGKYIGKDVNYFKRWLSKKIEPFDDLVRRLNES